MTAVGSSTKPLPSFPCGMYSMRMIDDVKTVKRAFANGTIAAGSAFGLPGNEEGINECTATIVIAIVIISSVHCHRIAAVISVRSNREKNERTYITLTTLVVDTCSQLHCLEA